MRLVLCSELFFAIFAFGIRALESAGILCQNCFTMPLCCLTKCWGFPLLRRALRREPVHGMGPEWAFLRTKGWHSPIPVVCSHSAIITSPSMLEKVSFEACSRWEKILLTIFFFSLLIFRRLFSLSVVSLEHSRLRTHCSWPRFASTFCTTQPGNRGPKKQKSKESRRTQKEESKESSFVSC